MSSTPLQGYDVHLRRAVNALPSASSAATAISPPPRYRRRRRLRRRRRPILVTARGAASTVATPPLPLPRCQAGRHLRAAAAVIAALTPRPRVPLAAPDSRRPHQSLGTARCIGAVRTAVKSPAPHEHVPPGQRGLSPQGQAWLAAGGGGRRMRQERRRRRRRQRRLGEQRGSGNGVWCVARVLC